MSEIDPETLSDDDLEKALSLGDNFVPQPPVAEPEPVAEPAPSTDEAEPAPETETPPAPEPETAEVLEAERLRLLSEELEARAKHWESVAGRNAGELGFIKSQLKAIQEAQMLQARDPMDETGERQAPPPPQPPPGRDGVVQWAVQQAVQQAVGSFESSHPEVKDLGEKMGEYLKSSGYSLESVFKLADPMDAQREIGRALEEAYWHTKAATTAARRAELSAKREAVQMEAAKAKIKASVSGTASTPPPKPQPKTQEEMSDSELEAEMVRVMGGRW